MSRTMKIAFAHGGIVPGSVLAKKTKDDKKVGPHEPVDVETSYGESLIADKFAYAWDAKTAPKPPTDPLASASEQAAAILQAAAEKADEIAKAAVAKAEKIGKDAAAKAEEITKAAEAKAKEIVVDAEAKADEIVKAAKGQFRRKRRGEWRGLVRDEPHQ